MSVRLPTIQGDAVVGRESGTLSYVQGERIIGRSITTPTDPRTIAQQTPRASTSASAKTYANALTPAQRAVWATASRYSGNGLLEFQVTSLLASLIGFEPPTTRTADPIPNTPELERLQYRVTPFDLRLAYAAELPAAGKRILLYATPPSNTPRQPQDAERLVIGSFAESGADINLTAAYLATFLGRQLTGEPVRIQAVRFDPAIPSNSDAQVLVARPNNPATDVNVIQQQQPIPRLGTSTVQMRVLFTDLPISDPVTVDVEAGSLVWSGPTTIPNSIQQPGTLFDFIDIARTTTVQWTFTQPVTGEVRIVTLQPNIL